MSVAIKVGRHESRFSLLGLYHEIENIYPTAEIYGPCAPSLLSACVSRTVSSSNNKADGCERAVISALHDVWLRANVREG